MADLADSSPAAETPPLPSAPSLADLRLPIGQLPRVHLALARAFGEAGLSGQELPGLFANGVKATCVACGLSVTGAEIGELAVTEDENRDRTFPPKLERLRLGYCPRSGCESRFIKVEITGPGRFDRGWVLGRAQQLIEGKGTPLLTFRTSVSPATKRMTQRLALVALGTLFVAFVAYRLVFFRSQPIPFVKPKSPFTVEPASIDPNQR